MKRLIKKWFKLFDQQDIERALANMPHAKDREDFEWKFRNQLAQLFEANK